MSRSTNQSINQSINRSSNQSINQSIRTLYILICLMSLLPVNQSASYFISSYGSDTNNGTSMSSSWKSMNRVYQAMTSSIQSGDSINFCINQRWTYSMIDASVAGVSYGAYDCVNQRLIPSSESVPINQRPQITPSIDLDYRRWSISPINQSINRSVPTLQYDYSNDPVLNQNGLSALWVNNIRYHLARYPNIADPINQVTWGIPGEFSQMDNITSTIMWYRSINQPIYQKSASFWNGVRMHFRIANWIYFESFVVSSTVVEDNQSTNRTVNRVQLDREWGQQGAFQFHFEAHPNGRYPQHKQLLDQVGEFVLDQSTNKLFLIPLDLKTANGILDGSISVSGLYANGGSAAFIRQRNITFSNIEFTQSNGGMIVQNSMITVKSCSITHVLGSGYQQSSFQANNSFINNYVDDVEATCVTGNGITVLIEGNSINRCGMYARTATTNSNPSWNGVTISYGMVRNNRIIGCGYACVAPHQGATVDSNYIQDAMMTLNDGGAVYSYGSTDNNAKVVNNIIVGVSGNYLSYTPNRIAPCLYLDEGTYGALLQNNSCVGAAHCVYLNQAFSHSILMNDCQCPGLYASKGSGHLFAGNLVVSTGTNNYWQNPIVRATSATSNFNGLMTMFDQAYCIKGTGYMFQRQTVDGTARYDSFDGWRNDEMQYNPQWERGSRGVTQCDGWKPINYTSSDPWAFLSSSSSSTGSAVISSSSSSVRSSSSSLPVISSSSTGSTNPTSSNQPVGSSSSSSPQSSVCSYAGPFTQPATKITLNLRIPSVVAATLDLLFKDLDRWFELHGYVDLAWRVNLECGSFGPISQSVNQSSRRRILGTDDTYQLVFYVVDFELAADASAEFMSTVTSLGWTGELSSSQSVNPSGDQLVAAQQCEDGSTVTLYEQCPVAIPTDDVSSSSSSGMIGGLVGGIIGGLVVFGLIGFTVFTYHRRSQHSMAVSPRASPAGSPIFNMMKGSPSLSPHLDAGVTLEKLSLSSSQSINQSVDQSTLTPRFELSTSQAPFLQMPASPMSAGYSPSASYAAYNMMPPSPQMLHPHANNQSTNQSTSQSVKTPHVEYYRMPAQPLQLPKGRPVTFSKPLPDQSTNQSVNQSPNQSMTARVHSTGQSINQSNNGPMSARATPPVPANRPVITRSPNQSPNQSTNQSVNQSTNQSINRQDNNRTPSQSPPSTARPALPMTRPNVNKI